MPVGYLIKLIPLYVFNVPSKLIDLKWSWKRHHWYSIIEWVVEWCIAVIVGSKHISRWLFLH